MLRFELAKEYQKAHWVNAHQVTDDSLYHCVCIVCVLFQGDITRYGERKLAGLMKDGYNSAHRLVCVVITLECYLHNMIVILISWSISTNSIMQRPLLYHVH